MKRISSVVLLLAACSQQPAETSLTTGTFAGQGRDRLCIAGQPGAYRSGLIAYGRRENNCSASGRLVPAGQHWELIPKGEGSCRIPLLIDGNVIRIGEVPAACSYYCGPGATMAGKSYNRGDMGAEVTDLAGDPLC